MFEIRPPPDGEEFALPQSGARLTWQMEMIGWGRAELAHRLNVRVTKVGMWEKGKSNIPNSVSAWLESLARLMAAMPMPPGWIPDKSIGRARHQEGVRGVSIG
jgi:hypothetical protein